MALKSIMVTGVYGLVGSSIYRHLAEKPERYQVYGMDRSRNPSDRLRKDEAAKVPDSRFELSDLSDLDALETAFQKVDTIVHMAGDPDPEASWESIRTNNIDATYHMFEAAQRAGVRRVVYASSIHVSFGYFHNVEPYRSIKEGNYEKVPAAFDRITPSDPAWPVNLYGTSKVFGESLARMYSSATDLSCLCIRMGGVHPMDEVPKAVIPNASTQNDMNRLIENCILAPDTMKFEVLYGLSNSDFRWVDLSYSERAVGYVPKDRITLEE